MLKLERPSLNLFPQFQQFLSDMQAHGQTLWSPYTPQENESPNEFIEKLLKRSKSPEPGMVPETIYWAIFEDHVVGRISLRHELNENLSKVGGHIGYEVSPSFRRKGFATEMLKQILLTPKAKEIGNLLLTCAPDNLASNKTIISNGGILKKTIYVDNINAERNHYWIERS